LSVVKGDRAHLLLCSQRRPINTRDVALSLRCVRRFDISEIAAPYARNLLLEGQPQFAALQKDFGKRWNNQNRAVKNLFRGPNQIEDIAGTSVGWLVGWWWRSVLRWVLCLPCCDACVQVLPASMLWSGV
jgi:hypothetical protein